MWVMTQKHVRRKGYYYYIGTVCIAHIYFIKENSKWYVGMKTLDSTQHFHTMSAALREMHKQLRGEKTSEAEENERSS